MSTRGSSRPRSASETAHHIHHKIAWKAINIDAKHVIFRCDGICKDDPKVRIIFYYCIIIDKIII